MRNGDMVAAAFLWEEADLGRSDNLQIFDLILPRLTFLVESVSRHGFKKDPTRLNEEELAMVQRIGKALVDSGQAKVRCFNRHLGELGTKVVAEAMTTNSVTYELNLEANNMGDAGAQALAESLKINRSLRILSLWMNNIGAAGAEALGESLKINRSLRILSLQSNNTGAAGAEALGESLKINTTLEDLELDHNNISDAGAEALAESLKTNSSLKNLHLDCNNIGAAGAQALAAGLLQNRGLRRLALSNGCGGDEGRQALEDAEKTKRRRGEDFQISWRWEDGLAESKRRIQQGERNLVWLISSSGRIFIPRALGIWGWRFVWKIEKHDFKKHSNPMVDYHVQCVTQYSPFLLFLKLSPK